LEKNTSCGNPHVDFGTDASYWISEKDNLNELISEKILDLACTDIVLSGVHWVNSLFKINITIFVIWELKKFIILYRASN
jgi:hypothetical protein